MPQRKSCPLWVGQQRAGDLPLLLAAAGDFHRLAVLEHAQHRTRRHHLPDPPTYFRLVGAVMPAKSSLWKIESHRKVRPTPSPLISLACGPGHIAHVDLEGDAAHGLDATEAIFDASGRAHEAGCVRQGPASIFSQRVLRCAAQVAEPRSYPKIEIHLRS